MDDYKEEIKIPEEKYSPQSIIILIVLLLIYTSCQFNRTLISYLYAIKDDDMHGKYSTFADDTNLTDVEYGILTGYGFSIIYLSSTMLIGGNIVNYVSHKYIFMIALIYGAVLY